MKKLHSHLSLKRLFKGLFFIAFFLLISNSLWSQTYNLQLVRVSNNGTTLTVKVQMSLSSAENLGTSNLVFTYDGAEMNTPVLGTIHNFSGGNYETMTLTSPATNTVSLNIELSTDDAGTALATGAGFTDVAEISFTLPDQTGTANFQWLEDGGTTKTVVYQDDNDTRLISGTLTDNDLTLDAAPTDITLSSTTIAQSATGVNREVGTFTTTDSDDVAFTYTEVAGAGDDDNGSFNLNGDKLRTDGALPAGSYDIRINTNDGVNDFEKTFSITVTDDIAPNAPSTPNMTTATDSGNEEHTAGATSDNLTNDQTPTFEGTAEAGATVKIFSNVHGLVGSGTATGGNYSITTSTLDAGAHTITATVTDAATNSSGSSSGLSIEIDVTQPTVNVSTTSTDPTNDNPIPVTITFNSEAENMKENDITVVNGTTGDFASADSTTFTVNITPSGNGNVQVSVGAGRAFDRAGNANTVSNTLSLDYDATAPTLTNQALTQTDSDDLEITYRSDEPGTLYYIVTTNSSTPSQAQILAGNDQSGTSTNVVSSGNAAVTVTGSDQTIALNGLTLASTTYHVFIYEEDGVGNESSVVTNSAAVDATAPTVSSSSPADDATGVDPTADITVTFNENMKFGTGFFQLIRSSDDAVLFSINAAAPTATSNVASISGAVLTINPGGSTPSTSTGYYLFIHSGTPFLDLAGNAFTGFTGSTDLNFTTLTPNSAPSFTIGANQTVSQSAGATTINSYATSINDNDGGGQTLTFNISNDNNSIFDVQPDIDETTGNLTFTPKSSTFGKATVTVSLSDDGGTASGGVDQSADQTFDIFITPDNIKINEVHASAGTDAEFIEVYNTGASATSLSGLVMVWFNGNDDLAYKDFDLTGSTSSSGFYVIGETAFATKDQDWGATSLQNGPDAVAIYVGSATDFTGASAPTTDGLVDVIVYGSTDDAALRTALGNPSLQVEGDASNSISRTPDGTGGFVVQVATPQATNDVTPPTITSVSIPNSAAKVGDAITVTVVAGESGLTLNTGQVNGVNVTGFTNSSGNTYTATYTVAEGNTDRAAGDDVPVNFILTDGASNNSTAFTTAISQASDAIDANSPTVTAVGMTNGSAKVGDAISINITASEAGLSLNTGQVNGVNVTGFTDNGGGSYSATYTVAEGNTDRAAGDDVPVNFILQDATGNTSATFTTAISQGSDAIDANSPTITNVSMTNAAAKVGDAIAINITASESGLSLSTGQVNGVNVTGFTDNGGGSYSATYTVAEGNTDRAAGDDVPVNFIMADAAGNNSATFTTAISQASDAIDANTPTITNVTIPNTAAKVGDAITVSITAGEAGLSLNTGQVNGVNVTGFTDGGGGSYSATYTVVEGNTDRAAGDDVPVNFILGDAAGNNSATFTTAISQASDAIDANSPTVTAVGMTNASAKVGDAITITITASEAGLSLNTGQVNGVNVSGFTDNGGGSYSATYTVAEGNTDRAAEDDIPVNFTLEDAAGNTSASFTTAISQGSDAIDANSPTVTAVGMTNASAKVGDAIAINITANEAGLSLSTGQVNGVNVTGFTDNGGGSYSATYSVVEGNTDRAAGDDVPVNFILADAAGNTSATFTTAISQGSDAIDANSPVVTVVTIPNSAAKVGDAVTVSITAGEAGLSLNTGQVNGVNVTGFTDNGGGSYSATYTVVEGNTDRAAGDDVPVNFILQDAAGNNSTAFTTAISQGSDAIDANSPTVTAVGMTNGSAKVGDAITINITASEAGLSLNTGQVNGVNVTGFTDNGGGSYSATYTVAEGNTDRAAEDDIPVNFTLEDAAGNTSASFTTAISQGSDAIDANSPAVTAVGMTNGSAKVGDAIAINITASESGLSLSTGQVNGVNVTGFTDNGGGSYSATYTVAEGNTDRAAEDDIPVNFTLEDAAGNTSASFTTAISQGSDAIDANSPSVTTVSIPNSTAKVGDAVTVSITTGEAGLSLNTGQVNGVNVTGFTDNGGGSYSATYTVVEGNTDRAAGDDVPVNFILGDAAGNNSATFTTAISQASDAIDANSPTVTAVGMTNGSAKVGDAITITITASEAGLSLNTGQVNGVNVSGFTDNGGGSYSATYTVVEGNTDRAAGDDVPVSFILQDAAGNNSATFTTAISQASDAIDANSPTVTAVGMTNASAKVGDAITISITASEAGLSLNAGQVNGVNVTGFTDNGGGSYSATYTVVEGNTDRAAGDDVPVSFILGDAAGNTSAAFTTAISQASDAIDANSPTIVSTSPTDDATDVGISGDITITFNEDIAFGNGSIQIIDLTDGSNTVTIDVTSPGTEASISGAVLTLSPTKALDLNSDYAVQMPNSAIDDVAGNSFAGIVDFTTFNFTTINTSVAFDATTSNASESTSSANLAVSLNAASGSTVTVNWVVTGTATGNGTDYTLADGTLTFNPGDVTKNLIIASIIDDALDENDETVIVTLSNPTNAGLGSNTQHTYTINDDDVTPTVAFNTTSSNGAESVGSADLQVDLSAVSGRDVTVSYTITGTATGSGTDYTLANGALVISAGDANNNITIASIVDDALDEVNETVIVTLSGPTNATLGTNTVHTYTINDDDATPTIEFNTTTSQGPEATSSANLQVDLSAVSGQTVTVDYTVTGTATGSGSDYTLADGTLTLTAGASLDNITIASIIANTLDEDDETVIVTLSNPTNATLGTNTVHTYTIQDDDDSPTTGFVTISSNGDESAASATLSVALTGESGRDIMLDYTVTGTATGSGTDYTLADGTFTLEKGLTNKDFTISGIVDDAILEADETIIITLSNPVNAILPTSNAVHTYTINDNDNAAVTLADVSQAENGGDITVTATLDNAVEGGFTVDVSTADGTAETSDSDYTAVTSQTLTFTGTAGETQTFTITPGTDTKVETNETVTVSMGNLANTSVSVDISDGATVTINNDDTAIVTIADVTAAENSGTQAIIATLSGEVQGGFAFDVFTSDGTGTVADGDYSSTAGSTLTFTGTNGETQQLSLGGLGDTKVEADETFTIGMQNIGFTSVNTTNIDITDVATYTITNDDAATLAINDVTKAENADGATTTFTFTTTLTGTIDQAFTVDFITSDGTAAAGTDYTASIGTLNFAGTTTGETQTFSVTVSNDALVEGDETFTVTLSNIQAGGKSVTISDATGIGTITNDDNAAVTIADVNGNEDDGNITLTATLDSDVPGGFTVDVSTADGTATTGDSDYTAVASQTLTFTGTAGETQTFTVSPTVDTKFETDETLTVAMSNVVPASAAASSIDISDGAAVTIDNDDTEPTVTLSVDNNSIAENGGTATLTATLSNLSVNDVDVTIGYSGTATNGTDYNSSASTTITVSAESMSATAAVIITALDDASAEGDETIIADITGVTNGSEDGAQSETITILDDDAAIVTSIASSTANGSYKAGDLIEIQVTFNRAVNVTGTPQLTLETGTTDQTADYASGDGTTTLTFNYTVQAGDVSSDLDYVDANALMLNGGTIIGNGLNAILDLPAPGATNSLGDNAAIIVDTSSPADPVVTTPATDILLNAATQTVSGTHGENGVTIILYADSENNGVADNASVLATATVSGNAWSLTANLTGDAVNNFVVQAADAAGNTSADVDVPTITEDSTDPVITSDGGAATAGINVNENSTAVTTVTATDANAVTFTISGGTDQALFSMASGVLTFTAAPDFENPGDADTDNAYVVEITASDGINTDDIQTITVTVVDLDDNSPVITSDGGVATAALNVNENTTAVTTVTATDADGVSTVAYSISGGADQALFTMASGVLTFTAAPDFENPGDADTDNAYVVEVTATDGTTTVDTQTITVTVVDQDDNSPVITSDGGGATAALNIDENSTAVTTVTATDADGVSTVTYSISGGADQALFSMASGVLTLAAAPDFENPGDADTDNAYVVEVTATDGTTTVDTQTITITVVDLDDNSPVITSDGGGATAGLNINENSTAVTTVTATDVDGVSTVTYSISGGADQALFSMTSGVLTFTTAPDFESPGDADSDNAYVVEVSATDGTTTADIQSITVTVLDQNDNTPVITAGQVLSVDETAANSATVGTVIATDQDAGTTFSSWMITAGNSAGIFGINAATGEVTIADNTNLSPRDITAAYTLTLSTSDGANTSSTETVLINILDTSAPATPFVESISDDTGSDGTDLITNDQTLNFIGTAEANSLVEIFVDGGSIGMTNADGSGDFTFDHTGTTLAAGSYAITAKASDASGNTSALSTGLQVTIDNILPAKPVITGVSDDNGVSNNDHITNDRSIIFSGTAEALSKVGVLFPGGNTRFTTTDANGDWVLDFSHRDFFNGTYPFSVTVTDIAGNVSPVSDGFTLVIDYNGPTVSSMVRADANPTAATSVDYTVTFNEEVHGLSTSNFGLVFTGTQNANIASISATSGISMTVTVNNITGEGTFRLDLTNTTGITDVAGNNLSSTFNGQIYTTNTSPSNITLSSTSILENNSIGDAVGTLSSSDIDAGDTHAYTLVSGTGDADNASFTINGTQLEAAAVFDRETKASYNIRLQTDDGNGGIFQKAFIIAIDNVAEADLRITGNNDIPATPLGITTSFDITLHNDGDAAMSVTSILYPIAFGGPVSGINIAAASSQVITMTFTPTAAQVYTGDITIVTNGGTGVLSVSADGAIITGTDDGVLSSEAINIYPNPASDLVTVDLSEFNGRPLDIQLFDLSGTKAFGVTDFKEATLKLDIRTYQQGIYLMYFTDGKNTVKKKFMIRK